VKRHISARTSIELCAIGDELPHGACAAAEEIICEWLGRGHRLNPHCALTRFVPRHHAWTLWKQT
jgi:hypothetical protein